MNYNHYIALDWSQKVMAFARLTQDSEFLEVKELPSNVLEFKIYLRQLKGPKILSFEESGGSQWLYTELRDCVDEILVCDPYRNHLLKEGPKTDKIDARKLVVLLKAGLLKPVYHSAEDFIYFRKLVSGYQDLVRSGVRLKNQRFALFQINGRSAKEKSLKQSEDRFVLEGLDRGIEAYEKEKTRYQQEFHRLTQKYPALKHLESISGIGEIGAMKIAAHVVDARRFKKPQDFWSYCGLVKHEKISGGRSYGKKNPRYCRTLKSVFKTAVMSVIQERLNNPFRDYYLFLKTEKNYPDHNARQATARRIATVSLSILKNGENFNPRKFNLCKTVTTLTNL